MGQRLATLALGALAVAATSAPMAVLAATTTYEADGGRGVFAVFDDRNGDNRTRTTVFAVRGDVDEVDGDTFRSPVVTVWTVSWNTDKDKVRRAAFGIADERDDVEVNVAGDLTSATVAGRVRMRDAVKDDAFTLDLDLRWTRDGNRDALDLDRTFAAPPDDRYTQRVTIESAGNEARPASASGDILRGATDLVNRKSNDADIFELGDATVRVSQP